MKTPYSYGHFVRKIDQIDSILREPLEGLVSLLPQAAGNSPISSDEVVKWPLFFPSWVAKGSGYRWPREVDTPLAGPPPPLATAIVCAVLQRLWRRRRRWPQFRNTFESLNTNCSANCAAAGDVPSALAQAFLPPSTAPSEDDYVRYLTKMGLLGHSNPWFASQMLWVLIQSSEADAYSGVAFLAFFGLLWSLRRRHPDPLTAGASVGFGPPNAYVTARCLEPIRSLRTASLRRAVFLEETASRIKAITDLLTKPEAAYILAVELDALANLLGEYSPFALSPGSFRQCAEDIEALSGDLTLKSDIRGTWELALGKVAETFRVEGEAGKRVAASTEPALGIMKGWPKEELTEPLGGNGLIVPTPTFAGDRERDAFWRDQNQAAACALEICDDCYKLFKNSYGECARKVKAEAKAIQDELATLARANRQIASRMHDAVRDSIQWCGSVYLREVAYSSAGESSRFDPAELVSGLAVAVKMGLLHSPLEVENAVSKALSGVRPDGSWMPGQPFYVDARLVLGDYAPSAAISWLLASTVNKFPEVTAADKALTQYVDWLERTRTSVVIGATKPACEPLSITGWVAEQRRRPERVDLWLTAFAIHSLLDIRALFEYRILEECERRFTVVRHEEELSGVQPVDSGLRHKYRLHRKLSRLARRVESEQHYKQAEYALLLHGPPGSSKTLLAKALSKSLWSSVRRLGQKGAQNKPRLIRITPADFTRGGEAEIDAEARVLFELLSRVRGVTILFDEIDDFLARRSQVSKGSFIGLVVPAMLNRLQDLRESCPSQEVAFVLATNYVEKIEPALIRKGRIDSAVAVVYPDDDSLRAIFAKRSRKVAGEVGAWANVPVLNLFKYIQREKNQVRMAWPYMTVASLCDEIEEFLKKEGTRNSLKAESQWDELANGVKTGIEEYVREVVARYQDGVPSAHSLYVERQESLLQSAELQEEFVRYLRVCVSSSETLEECVKSTLVAFRSEKEQEGGKKKGRKSELLAAEKRIIARAVRIRKWEEGN